MSNISVKELVEAKLAGIKAEIKAGYDMNQLMLKQILKHQEKTNGKVQIIYSETSFFRWIQRNPKLSVLVGIIIVSIIVWGITEIGVLELINLAK